MKRELDAEIAEKVMGHPAHDYTNCFWCKDDLAGGYASGNPHIENYSTNNAAAWAVVERLQALGYGVIVKAYPPGFSFAYSAAIPGTPIGAQADTGPMAICKAALATLDQPPPEEDHA